MKKRILVYAFVLIAALTLVGCKNGSSDSLLSLQFNGPGVMTTNGRYALMDHVYTADDYSVTAFYSSGSKVVTKEAKITSKSDNIEIGSDNTLKFTDPNWNGPHQFYLTIEYGGKRIDATVVAYGAGEAIGGLRLKKPKFLVGERIGTTFAGISFLDKSGNYISSSSSLPSSALLIVEKKDGAGDEIVVAKEFGEGYIVDGTETQFVYLTYLEADESTFFMSKPEQINPRFIVPSDIVSGRINILSSYPKTGDVYNADFCKTYLSELKVTLKDSDGNSYVVYATDEDGSPINGFSAASIEVKSKTGDIRTFGTFETGDVVTIKLNYGGVSIVKNYTVSRR